MVERSVVITGPMGVGKSTTAAALAAELGVAHRDSDADIISMTGMTGRELAAERGVEDLHRLEAQVFLDALASEEPTVISAAASVVENSSCRAAMAELATVVVLDLDTTGLLARIASGDHRRPMAAGDIEATRHRRAPLFREIADLTLDATRPTEHLLASILPAL